MLPLKPVPGPVEAPYTPIPSLAYPAIAVVLSTIVEPIIAEPLAKTFIPYKLERPELILNTVSVTYVPLLLSCEPLS